MIPLPAGPLLFDTGIYIRFSRGENYLWLCGDARVFQRTILTAVVAANRLEASWPSIPLHSCVSHLKGAHDQLANAAALGASDFQKVSILDNYGSLLGFLTKDDIVKSTYRVANAAFIIIHSKNRRLPNFAIFSLYCTR